MDNTQMTEEEFKKRLQEDGYTNDDIELLLQVYQTTKNWGFDVTAHYDEFYGKPILFDD